MTWLPFDAHGSQKSSPREGNLCCCSQRQAMCSLAVVLTNLCIFLVVISVIMDIIIPNLISLINWVLLMVQVAWDPLGIMAMRGGLDGPMGMPWVCPKIKYLHLPNPMVNHDVLFKYMFNVPWWVHLRTHIDVDVECASVAYSDRYYSHNKWMCVS